MIKTPKIAIVVPCYNEQDVLPETMLRLTTILNEMSGDAKISDDSFILFVNDGSRDNTWQIIEQNYGTSKYVCGLNLAANVGHQNALMAGLNFVADKCDAAISIDADLQDDVNAIKEMVAKFGEGCEIVYGVRRSRDTDTWFKRTTALTFYKMMQKMGVKSIYNHADYRLMSARALKQLSRYREINLFLRGIVPLLGYKTDSVYYDRAQRFAGESKYPLSKMVNFAVDGITSFSIKPVRLILYIGLIFVIVAIIVSLYSLIRHLTGATIPGWTSLIVSIWFVGGCLLTALGVIGEYIGKIYIEVKDRPRYNIEKILPEKNKNGN